MSDERKRYEREAKDWVDDQLSTGLARKLEEDAGSSRGARLPESGLMRNPELNMIRQRANEKYARERDKDRGIDKYAGGGLIRGDGCATRGKTKGRMC